MNVNAVRFAEKVEATTGFEPVNRGFADLAEAHDNPRTPTWANVEPRTAGPSFPGRSAVRFSEIGLVAATRGGWE